MSAATRPTMRPATPWLPDSLRERTRSHKVTIIPRGMALGVTQQLPVDDRHTFSKDYILKRLAIMFGGRVAEELVLGHTTTGAGDDLEKATDLARRMVCEWGMSESLGPMTFGKKGRTDILGPGYYPDQGLL